MNINEINYITEHFPAGSFSEKKRRISKFNTLDELFEIDFVKKWKEGRLDFIKFSKEKNTLMVEYYPTNKWPVGCFWVVGYLKYPDKVDLPIWKETPLQTEQRKAWNRGDKTFIFEGIEYKV